MNETFEQFCERMSRVEKKEEFYIGRECQGNSRAVFEFEGQCCLLESFGFRRLPPSMGRPHTPAAMFYLISGDPPTSHWFHCKLIYTKKRAKMLMEHYHASGFEEDPYPREEGVWFSLRFDEKDGDEGWTNLMRMVWDIHTGRFAEMFGDEEKTYESCIGYVEEKTA